MRTTPLEIALGLMLAAHASAQTPPSPLVVASADSRWEHVYCDVTQLSRTAPSELMIRFQYRNACKATFSLPHTELVPSTRVLDSVGRVLFGVLKDTAGKPIVMCAAMCRRRSGIRRHRRSLRACQNAEQFADVVEGQAPRLRQECS